MYKVGGSVGGDQVNSLVTSSARLPRAYTSKLLETRRLADVRRKSVCIMTERNGPNTMLNNLQ